MRRLFPVTEEVPGRTGRLEPRQPGEPGEPGEGESAHGAGTDGTVRHRAAGGAGRALAVDREWGFDELAEVYAYPEPRPLPEPRPAGAGGAGPGPDDGPASAPGRGPAPAPGRGPAVPRVWLRANMVASLDGAAQHAGHSEPISGSADMRVFGVLRALADVVIVGAQTVRQEGYRPARAHRAFAERRAAAGQPPAPAIAVVSASLDLDFSLPLFTAPLVPTLVVTGAAAPPERLNAARDAGVRVVLAGAGAGVEPAQVVRALGERGHSRLLIEGGPRLLGQFVAVSVLDELCLTLSPVLTAGKAQRIAGGPAVMVPDRFGLASVLEEDGFLFTRYVRI